MEKEILKAAKTLWDYLRLGQPLKKCDCIIAMGSHDLRVAEYAANLVVNNWAPLMICSGGLGRLTKEIWHESEAEKFAHIAEAAGVPKERILVEDCSTNTGENILFSKSLLEEKGYVIKSTIMVHKPYMERRAFATAKFYWPELKVVVSSPQIPFEEYATAEIPMDEVIQIMVGDFQRILVYPEKGFQVAQEIPNEANEAFKSLVNHGYTQYLVAS
ncbi:MAG: YdcF family protein [Pelolinea sp.]|nr:YdcF family protein [Pelolinea sp.]